MRGIQNFLLVCHYKYIILKVFNLNAVWILIVSVLCYAIGICMRIC